MIGTLRLNQNDKRLQIFIHSINFTAASKGLTILLQAGGPACSSTKQLPGHRTIDGVYHDLPVASQLIAVCRVARLLRPHDQVLITFQRKPELRSCGSASHWQVRPLCNPRRVNALGTFSLHTAAMADRQCKLTDLKAHAVDHNIYS
jgi:hypothetical protein